MRMSRSIVLSLALISCNNAKDTDPLPLDTAVSDTDADTDADSDTDTDTDAASPPEAVEDEEEVDEGDAVTVDLTANDTDPDGDIDQQSVLVVDPPANGLVIINGDGTVDYLHDGSETVDDEFSYGIQDLTGLSSNVATVLIEVNPVNDPPVANDDNGITQEGSGTSINLASDDVDPDDGVDPASIVITDPPSFGSVAVNPDGTVDYTHDGSELPTDSFRYTVDDFAGSTSNIAYVSVSIIAANDAPIAVDDINFLDQGGFKNLPLASNDSDPDDGLDLTSVRIVGQPTNGTVSVRLDGTVDYTHDGSQTVADSFMYTIEDFAGASSNVANVDLTINAVAAVNTPPTAIDDVGSADEGATGNIDLASNDTDPDDGVDPSQIVITSLPVYGIVQVVGDGTVDYTHDGSETIADSFAYTIDDFSGAPSNAATVAVTIDPVNDAPVANDDAGFVDEGLAATFDLSGNDTDDDDGIDPTGIVIAVPPANGAVVINGDGTVDYLHDGSETVVDAFAYTISDLSGAVSNVAVVDVTIGAVNNAPTAVDDNGLTIEGGGVTVDLAANDIDPDDGIDVTSISIITPPTNGALVDNGDGSFDYTHNGSETSVDVFSYTIDDLSGLTSNIATVTINISPVNSPPIANDDAANLDEGALEIIDVAANDTDLDSSLNLASIQVVTPPINGTYVVNGDGTVSYTHDDSNSVLDSFTYTIEDAFGALSNQATVSLTINSVNDAPVANDDFGNVDEGSATNVNLAINDTDVDGTIDVGSVVITTPPTAGTVVVQFNGTMDYFHDGSEGAVDVFGYTIDDNLGATSNEGTITITINPVNDVPTAVDDIGIVNEGAMATFDLAINDIDPDDGLNLASLVVTSPPTNGTIVVNGDGTVDYTHDGSETSADGFLYTIGDMAGQTSNTGAVVVTINPVNDLPVAVDDIGNVDQGANLNLLVSFNDSDGDDGLDLNSIQIVTPPSFGTAVPQPLGVISYTHDGSNNLVDSFTYTIDDNSGASSNVANVDFTMNSIGTHMTEPFVPTDSQGQYCDADAPVNYRDYGLMDFDACQDQANRTGTQWFGGAWTDFATVWIGDQDLLTNAVVTGASWPTEELRARGSLISCVLGQVEHRTEATANPVEQLHTDAVGRNWHFWDLTSQTVSQAMSFADDRGARIINPSSIGQPGLARMTAPTHWCHASAEFNGGGSCNSDASCNFMVGYYE